MPPSSEKFRPSAGSLLAMTSADRVRRTDIVWFFLVVSAHVSPPSVVCHTPPPTPVPLTLSAAQPSSLSLNQNSLNQTEPAPPPMTGAMTGFHVTPPSVVRRTLNSSLRELKAIRPVSALKK